MELLEVAEVEEADGCSSSCRLFLKYKKIHRKVFSVVARRS